MAEWQKPDYITNPMEKRKRKEHGPWHPTHEHIAAKVNKIEIH